MNINLAEYQPLATAYAQLKDTQDVITLNPLNGGTVELQYRGDGILHIKDATHDFEYYAEDRAHDSLFAEFTLTKLASLAVDKHVVNRLQKIIANRA